MDALLSLPSADAAAGWMPWIGALRLLTPKPADSARLTVEASSLWEISRVRGPVSLAYQLTPKEGAALPAAWPSSPPDAARSPLEVRREREDRFEISGEGAGWAYVAEPRFPRLDDHAHHFFRRTARDFRTGARRLPESRDTGRALDIALALRARAVALRPPARVPLLDCSLVVLVSSGRRLRRDWMTRRDLIVVGALAAAVLALTAPVWAIADRAFFNHGDIYAYHWPLRHHTAAALIEGRLPFWNPYVMLGMPHAANPQAALFIPRPFWASCYPL